MILKLKEIHQYTHQLASSDSEDEDRRPPAQVAAFKEPRAPPAASPVKSNGAGKEAGQASDEAEPLSASQGSSASSMAASDESERYGGDGSSLYHHRSGVDEILRQHCEYEHVHSSTVRKRSPL